MTELSDTHWEAENVLKDGTPVPTVNRHSIDRDVTSYTTTRTQKEDGNRVVNEDDGEHVTNLDTDLNGINVVKGC